nr:MAG TPA: hypothetical protein [Caudoviricetes sp.]
MGYTYKDNEKVALEIVKRLQGKVLYKWKSLNNSYNAIFTASYGPSDLEYKVGDYIRGLIRKINPDCILTVKWDGCIAEPKDSMGFSEGSAYAVRDTYYDDKDEEYYGTEIYIAACSTPTNIAYTITVCLESE